MPFFWVGGLAITLFPTLAAGGVVTCVERPSVQVLPLGNVAPGAEPEPPPGWKAFSSLGMTETFAIYAWGNESQAAGYPYVPLDFFEPGYQAKVVDPEGRPVADGGRGEILIRGPSLTRGRQGPPGRRLRRRRVLPHRGRGSRGRRPYPLPRPARRHDQDPDGQRGPARGRAGNRLVGRRDDRLRGGRPRPGTGPGGRRGRGLRGAQHLDVEELTATLRSRLSSFKVPRVVVFCANEEIPLTPTNKVDKRALAALIAARGVWSAR